MRQDAALFSVRAPNLMKCMSVLEQKESENCFKKLKRISLALSSLMKSIHCWQKVEEKVEKVVQVGLQLTNSFQKLMVLNKMKTSQ